METTIPALIFHDYDDPVFSGMSGRETLMVCIPRISVTLFTLYDGQESQECFPHQH